MSWIIYGLVSIALFFFAVTTYNSLIRSREATKNSWSQIDVQLKRRYDLIPKMVETARGFMAHEQETLEKVIKARQVAIDADGMVEQAKAENFLTQSLRSLMAVSESYPELKSDEHMLRLQEELASTENRISFSRQHYNDTAMGHNQLCEQFPTVAFANMFNVQKADYFELEDAAQREPVAVKF